jgi:hypothetical protein
VENINTWLTLPDTVAALRGALYPRLSGVANRWNKIMGIDVNYPADHSEYFERCHEAGQIRPTPLLLEYGEGDFNCLHQDVYGDLVFPLQVAFLLSIPGEDFTGGEFVLDSSRPRNSVAGHHGVPSGRLGVVAYRQKSIPNPVAEVDPVRAARALNGTVMDRENHAISLIQSNRLRPRLHPRPLFWAAPRRIQ